MTEKYALLLTSSQNDLLSPNGKAWGLTSKTVLKNEVSSKLKAIIAGARAVNIPVIHSPVSFDYAKLKDFEPLSAIQSVVIENRLLEGGTPGAEFAEETTPLEKELVLPPRQGFSSFWTDTIQSQLDMLGVTTIFIAGMLAEACVEAHSRDAVENGYRPIIISDAIGSTSVELLEASLKTLELHSANLMTTEEVLNHWQN